MYPQYKLQIYDPEQAAWIDSPDHEESNRPHHYDVLRKEFERLVKNAQQIAGKAAGFRIVVRGSSVVDVWESQKT